MLFACFKIVFITQVFVKKRLKKKSTEENHNYFQSRFFDSLLYMLLYKLPSVKITERYMNEWFLNANVALCDKMKNS